MAHCGVPVGIVFVTGHDAVVGPVHHLAHVAEAVVEVEPAGAARCGVHYGEQSTDAAAEILSPRLFADYGVAGFAVQDFDDVPAVVNVALHGDRRSAHGAAGDGIHRFLHTASHVVILECDPLRSVGGGNRCGGFEPVLAVPFVSERAVIAQVSIYIVA